MKKYSEFINFPIHLWASKEVDEEVPADEDDSSDEDEKCTHDINSPSFVTDLKNLLKSTRIKFLMHHLSITTQNSWK